MFDDPFDLGPDPDIEYGDLLSTGQQDPVAPRPPSDASNNRGWLSFPAGHNAEIASLGLYTRGDVRSCALLVSGGVYESLLFFPVIQLLKVKYPGVKIDVASNARAKQTYEINKNVRRAWVYDVADPFVLPAEFTEFVGKLKNENYDLVLSTRQAGMGHALLLFLTDARQRVSYVLPNASGAGAGVFLSHKVESNRLNLAEGGYHMYSDLLEYLGKPLRGTSSFPTPPLEFNIPKKVKAVAREKYEAAGAKFGEFTVIHGLESSSPASMRSEGDPDSSLSLELLSSIASSISGDLLVVIPHDRDWKKVAEALPSAKIVKITTPGQLAAIIDDAKAVVTTNTAAVPMTMYLQKPSVLLFGSAEKAALFSPGAKERGAAVVASKTGRLIDLDAKAVSMALSTLPTSVPVVA